MRIEEHIVINKPKTVREGTLAKQAAWTRHAVQKAVWELRKRVIKEQGVDLFQVFEMTDCVEVHIEGDFDTIPALHGWRLTAKRRKMLGREKRRR